MCAGSCLSLSLEAILRGLISRRLTSLSPPKLAQIQYLPTFDLTTWANYGPACPVTSSLRRVSASSHFGASRHADRMLAKHDGQFCFYFYFAPILGISPLTARWGPNLKTSFCPKTFEKKRGQK